MIRTLLTVLTLSLVACAHAATDVSRLSENNQSSIGYPTVDAAFADLTSQPGNVVSVRAGWTIVSNPNNLTLWSFTPEGHAAHPAAVKRTSVERDGAVYIEMQALCQAEKKPCDALIEEFKELNEQMRKYIQDQKTQERPNSSFKPTLLRNAA